jgi:probable phosphoglycerate mutase
MSARILLIRHAETARPDLLHGSESDIDISPRGQRQALALAQTLIPEQADALVCSNMLRARRTAGAIAEATGLTPTIEQRLHERAVGILSGQVKSVVKRLWPETVRRWRSGETAYTTEGAESIDDIRTRVLPVWAQLAEQHAGKKLIVVAHGMVIRVLLLTILHGYSLDDWDRLGSIHNCAITDLEQIDGVWRAHRINQIPPEVGRV